MTVGSRGFQGPVPPGTVVLRPNFVPRLQNTPCDGFKWEWNQ